jgi:hypothetical protein
MMNKKKKNGSSKCKVPIQKGPIDANPVTMAMETFDQKVYGDKKDQVARRSAQKPKMLMPKK